MFGSKGPSMNTSSLVLDRQFWATHPLKNLKANHLVYYDFSSAFDIILPPLQRFKSPQFDPCQLPICIFCSVEVFMKFYT
jgi:hypothetical protein